MRINAIAPRRTAVSAVMVLLAALLTAGIASAAENETGPVQLTPKIAKKMIPLLRAEKAGGSGFETKLTTAGMIKGDYNAYKKALAIAMMDKNDPGRLTRKPDYAEIRRINVGIVGQFEGISQIGEFLTATDCGVLCGKL